MRLRRWLIYERTQQKFLTSSFSYRVLNNSDWHIRSFWYQQQQCTHQKVQPLPYSRLLHSAQIQQRENDKHTHREERGKQIQIFPSISQQTYMIKETLPPVNEWTIHINFPTLVSLQPNTHQYKIYIYSCCYSENHRTKNSLISYIRNNLNLWIICEHWFPQWKIPMPPFPLVSTLKNP